MQRVLEPETLDHLPPDDPAALRSRRDLRRVNRVMGAPAILARSIERVRPSVAPGRALRILEIGCGDGRLMLDVARRSRHWPKVEIDLLDRQPLVDSATVAAYAAVGWRARPLEADVLDWAGGAVDGGPWDLVVANLFLHHFEGAALTRLLAGCAARADAIVACEPRRSRFALAASHLVVFIGANAVTREDAVLSVRAGFRAAELSAAWPVGPGWQLDEFDVGLFTHCLCAARQTTAVAANPRGGAGVGA